MELENKIYSIPPPTSPDCRRVWIEAGLPDYASLAEIQVALVAWVQSNCRMEVRNNRYHLTWTSPSGTRHEASDIIFLRWLLCACPEVVVMQPQPQPQPEPQITHISPPLDPSPSPSPPLEDMVPLDPIDDDDLASLEDTQIHITEEQEAALERVAIDREDARQLTEEEIEAFLNGEEDGNLVCYSLQEFLNVDKDN
jgi:hypothetical protein